MAELDIRAVTGGPLDVNTYVVGCEGSDSCVLIDPGAEEARVAEAVGKRRVDAVLLTHAHFDHMLHAQPWLDRGAKLYVHALDAQALRSPALNLSQVINTSLVLPKADVELQEGDVVREAGLALLLVDLGSGLAAVGVLLDPGLLQALLFKVIVVIADVSVG